MNQVKRGRKPKAASVSAPPLTEIPNPPIHLVDAASDYWKQLAPQLIEARILTQMHLESFAILCEQYAEYQELNRWISEDPERRFFTTDNGYMQETPQVRMRDKALATLQKLWPKFGLTPFALAQMRKHGGVSAGKQPVVIEFARKKYADEEEYGDG
jgi:P27 family predicted phage terminase small subunit